MTEAAGQKQERSLADARKMYGALLDRIDGEKSEIDHQIKVRNEDELPSIQFLSSDTEVQGYHTGWL